MWGYHIISEAYRTLTAFFRMKKAVLLSEKLLSKWLLFLELNSDVA